MGARINERALRSNGGSCRYERGSKRKPTNGWGHLRPVGFAVFADFSFRFSSTGRDFLGSILTRLGESYTVRYPAGAQGKGKSPRSPARVENGHSGRML